MHKVVLSLALSSRGRSILRMSMEEHLTALLRELLSTTTILTPGTYSVSLGKAWALNGAEPSEISVTLSFRSEPISAERSPLLRRAVKKYG